MSESTQEREGSFKEAASQAGQPCQAHIPTCFEKHKTCASCLEEPGGDDNGSPEDTALCARERSNVRAEPVGLPAPTAMRSDCPKPMWQHSPAPGHAMMRLPHWRCTWAMYADPVSQRSVFSLPPETAQLTTGDTAWRKGWATAFLQSPRKAWLHFSLVHESAGALPRIPNPPIGTGLPYCSGKPEHELKLPLNQCSKNSWGGRVQPQGKISYLEEQCSGNHLAFTAQGRRNPSFMNCSWE